MGPPPLAVGNREAPPDGWTPHVVASEILVHFPAVSKSRFCVRGDCKAITAAQAAGEAGDRRGACSAWARRAEPAGGRAGHSLDGRGPRPMRGYEIPCAKESAPARNTSRRSPHCVVGVMLPSGGGLIFLALLPPPSRRRQTGRPLCQTWVVQRRQEGHAGNLASRGPRQGWTSCWGCCAAREGRRVSGSGTPVLFTMGRKAADSAHR